MSIDYPSSKSRAEMATSLFSQAFDLFGQCHRGYNSSQYMSDKDITDLGNILTFYMYYNNYFELLESHITKFLKFYREQFPSATILPKMHVLEDHVIPWIRKWRLGSGLMGEQGAESIHAHVMKLERTHQSIPNDLDRLKYIFKEQTLESAPSLTSLRPPLKKRGPYKTKQPPAKKRVSDDQQ